MLSLLLDDKVTQKLLVPHHGRNVTDVELIPRLGLQSKPPYIWDRYDILLFSQKGSFLGTGVESLALPIPPRR